MQRYAPIGGGNGRGKFRMGPFNQSNKNDKNDSMVGSSATMISNTRNIIVEDKQSKRNNTTAASQHTDEYALQETMRELMDVNFESLPMTSEEYQRIYCGLGYHARVNVSIDNRKISYRRVEPPSTSYTPGEDNVKYGENRTGKEYMMHEPRAEDTYDDDEEFHMDERGVRQDLNPPIRRRQSFDSNMKYFVHDNVHRSSDVRVGSSSLDRMPAANEDVMSKGISYGITGDRGRGTDDVDISYTTNKQRGSTSGSGVFNEDNVSSEDLQLINTRNETHLKYLSLLKRKQKKNSNLKPSNVEVQSQVAVSNGKGRDMQGNAEDAVDVGLLKNRLRSHESKTLGGNRQNNRKQIGSIAATNKAKKSNGNRTLDGGNVRQSFPPRGWCGANLVRDAYPLRVGSSVGNTSNSSLSARSRSNTIVSGDSHSSDLHPSTDHISMSRNVHCDDVLVSSTYKISSVEHNTDRKDYLSPSWAGGETPVDTARNPVPPPEEEWRYEDDNIMSDIDQCQQTSIRSRSASSSSIASEHSKASVLTCTFHGDPKNSSMRKNTRRCQRVSSSDNEDVMCLDDRCSQHPHRDTGNVIHAGELNDRLTSPSTVVRSNAVGEGTSAYNQTTVSVGSISQSCEKNTATDMSVESMDIGVDTSIDNSPHHLIQTIIKLQRQLQQQQQQQQQKVQQVQPLSEEKYSPRYAAEEPNSHPPPPSAASSPWTKDQVAESPPLTSHAIYTPLEVPKSTDRPSATKNARAALSTLAVSSNKTPTSRSRPTSAESQRRTSLSTDTQPLNIEINTAVYDAPAYDPYVYGDLLGDKPKSILKGKKDQICLSGIQFNDTIRKPSESAKNIKMNSVISFIGSENKENMINFNSENNRVSVSDYDSNRAVSHIFGTEDSKKSKAPIVNTIPTVASSNEDRSTPNNIVKPNSHIASTPSLHVQPFKQAQPTTSMNGTLRSSPVSPTISLAAFLPPQQQEDSDIIEPTSATSGTPQVPPSTSSNPPEDKNTMGTQSHDHPNESAEVRYYLSQNNEKRVRWSEKLESSPTHVTIPSMSPSEISRLSLKESFENESTSSAFLGNHHHSYDKSDNETVVVKESSILVQDDIKDPITDTMMALYESVKDTVELSKELFNEKNNRFSEEFIPNMHKELQLETNTSNKFWNIPTLHNLIPEDLLAKVMKYVKGTIRTIASPLPSQMNELISLVQDTEVVLDTKRQELVLMRTDYKKIWDIMVQLRTVVVHHAYQAATRLRYYRNNCDEFRRYVDRLQHYHQKSDVSSLIQVRTVS